MTDIDPSFAESNRTVRLSETEAARAETTLHAFMKDHPVNISAAIHRKEPKRRFATFESFFSIRYGSVMAAVLVLVLGGGSLSYAAEYALPGDALYSIKIHVNEEVQAKLALSTAAKVRVATSQAAERMHEAESLAEQERLTPETRTQLVAAFHTHLADARANIQAVAKTGDSKGAAALNTQTENILLNHAANLDALAFAHTKEHAHAEIAQVLKDVKQATDDTVAFNDSLNVEIAANTASAAIAMNANASADASQSSTMKDYGDDVRGKKLPFGIMMQNMDRPSSGSGTEKK